MCGIIAIVRKPESRATPTSAEVLNFMEEAVQFLEREKVETISDAKYSLDQLNEILQGTSGLYALIENEGLSKELKNHLRNLRNEIVPKVEQIIHQAEIDPEEANKLIVGLRDSIWAIENDRLKTFQGVINLASKSKPPSRSGYAVLLSIQQALSAIDRMEVRGRDSAGIQITLWNYKPENKPAIESRLDTLYRSGAAHEVGERSTLFVIKAAAEIGELGDNTASIRENILKDNDLVNALTDENIRGSVLGHTRWASVGVVSEANAHPLDSVRADGGSTSLVTAVQNGDIDNYLEIINNDGLSLPADITSDAKVMPVLCSSYIEGGETNNDAFRKAVHSFEGSLAIAASMAEDPNRLHLSLRGSGQGLYVGFGEDVTVVASELYGVVEITSQYLRMDGEIPADINNPITSRGQIIEIDGEQAGSPAGLVRSSFDGRHLPIDQQEVKTAEITTRDIDRGDYPHYLLKEISESSESVRSTLRGYLIQDADGQLDVKLGTSILSEDLVEKISSGRISRIIVIGQGTAAIAAQAVAAAIKDQTPSEGLQVDAQLATELSGFGLRPNMSDTCVVAISQSGTTTDTNRTVDLAQARGAHVIAIVNRRNSDLADRADGVFYTSDGRDIEMSVASTKAFYAQVTAGFLLAIAIAKILTHNKNSEHFGLLEGLQNLPAAMDQMLENRNHIAGIASRHAPSRRYWAIVGNGLNLVAAREIRIKLSELCYKSISHDSTEDKKHIDLSSEPLIFVCAVGLSGSTADDVAKEVAIYRAHKAVPIVVCGVDDFQYGKDPDQIRIPAIHPRLAFILATMAGHLFGYEAAKAIDAQADPLREAHAAIEGMAIEISEGQSREDLMHDLHNTLTMTSGRFNDELRSGSLDGHLEASTAARLAGLFRYALGEVPLESYQREYGEIGTPGLVLDQLAELLVSAIGQLTRPIDAIKHQAKTVTVGISRTDETLLEARLTKFVLGSGSPRGQLSYRTLRLLSAIDPAISEIQGFTRYQVENLNTENPTIGILDRGGISTTIESRTDEDPILRGTKHRVANEREVLVTRGARDDRTLIIVPEVKEAETTGLALLHVQLVDNLQVDVLRSVLSGYHNRYDFIRDAVCETESELDESLLAEMRVSDLLIDPIGLIADKLRS